MAYDASGTTYNGIGYSTRPVRPQQVSDGITSITRIGSTATARVDHHSYQPGDSVTIAASIPQYNGTFTVTSVSGDYFSFTVTGTPESPATGNRSVVLNYDQIATGGSTTCMRSKSMSTIYCMGNNEIGQVGINEDNTTTRATVISFFGSVDRQETFNELTIGESVPNAPTSRTIAISGNHGCAVIQ
jgi:hypothetical protein